MKRVILPFFSLLMVIAILANTAGVTVYNHFCQEEGESSLSLTKEENCCSHKEITPEQKKHACCHSEAAVENQLVSYKKCCSQDAFTSQWQLNEFSFYKNILIGSYAIDVPIVMPQFQFTETFVVTSASSPPPLINSSRDLLLQHSVLLI